jgi:hypothetical protein
VHHDDSSTPFAVPTDGHPSHFHVEENKKSAVFEHVPCTKNQSAPALNFSFYNCITSCILTPKSPKQSSYVLEQNIHESKTILAPRRTRRIKQQQFPTSLSNPRG